MTSIIYCNSSKDTFDMANFISDSIQVHIVRISPENKPEYLVIKRSDNSNLYPSVWQVITGWIDNGETAIQTALREVQEETGLNPIKICTIPYVASFFNPIRDLVQFAPVFGMMVDNNAHVKLSVEHSEFKWLNFENCLDFLEFPTHKIGTEIFHNYIVMPNHWDRFEIHL